MSILAANWVIALRAVTTIGHLLFVELPREEAKRVRFLGEEYQHYSTTTPLLNPRLIRRSSVSAIGSSALATDAISATVLVRAEFSSLAQLSVTIP